MTPEGLDFDALQMRLHPAASRVEKLARETPASFVAFDLLAVEGRDLRLQPQAKRRRELAALLARVKPPIYLTPTTTDRTVAQQWLKEFEGAGLDGVIAKRIDAVYQPGKRAMLKIKHVRSADCVVAGFRWHKSGRRHRGLAAARPLRRRRDAASRGRDIVVHNGDAAQAGGGVKPLRKNAIANHPWQDWAGAAAESTRMPGAQSRWSAGKDLSWEPLRIERVCEVKYDHLQGDRFRHAAIFLRWRPDKTPKDCRYDQLEVTKPYELENVFGAGRRKR